MSKTDTIAIWPSRERFANITWQVSDVCNFKCSYCNPGNYGAAHRNLNTDRYIEVLDKILDYFLERNYTAFKIFFSGGEPSVWPPLLPVLDFVKSKIDRPLIAINTNFSRPLSWWEKNHTYFHDVVASFHVEFTDKKRYLENAKYLQYRMSYIAYRMLMHDDRFQEVVDFAEEIKSTLDNYVIEYAPLMEALSPHSELRVYKEAWKNEFLSKNAYASQKKVPFSIRDYPKPMGCHEVFENGESRPLNSNLLVAEGRNFFRGWKCWINDSIFIRPDGQIRLASCDAGKIIGNINEGEIRFNDRPIICPEARCNCGTDIYIPKVRADRELAVASLQMS